MFRIHGSAFRNLLGKQDEDDEFKKKKKLNDVIEWKSVVEQYGFTRMECLYFVPVKDEKQTNKNHLRCHCGNTYSQHILARDIKKGHYKEEEVASLLMHQDVQAYLKIDGLPFPDVEWNKDDMIARLQWTDSYGKIDFKDGDKKPAKYIRVSIDDNVDDVFDFMVDTWGIMEPQKPELVINITGGAKNFKLPKRTEIRLYNALVKVADTTSAWLITSGFSVGLMKLVGEAVRDGQSFSFSKFTGRPTHNIKCIGIGPWGNVLKRDVLVIKDQTWINPHDSVYRTVYPKGKVSSESYKPLPLDSNITHFVLVDNGFRNRFTGPGSVFTFVIKFLHLLMTNPKYPMNLVTLMVNGGKSVFEDVRNCMDNEIPVIVCEGTGRAADVFSEAYWNSDEKGELTKDEMNSLETKITAIETNWYSENEKTNCIQIVKDSCKRKDLFTMFDIRKNDDLDDCLLHAIIKGQKDSKYRYDHFNLAFTCNKAEFAETELMKQTVTFRKQFLHNKLTDAILTDKRAFVQLLLKQDIDLSRYLDRCQLKEIYNKALLEYGSSDHLLRLLHRYTDKKKKFTLGDIGLILDKLIYRYDTAVYFDDKKEKKRKARQLKRKNRRMEKSKPVVPLRLDSGGPHEIFPSQLYSSLHGVPDTNEIFLTGGDSQEAYEMQQLLPDVDVNGQNGLVTRDKSQDETHDEVVQFHAKNEALIDNTNTESDVGISPLDDSLAKDSSAAHGVEDDVTEKGDAVMLTEPSTEQTETVTTKAKNATEGKIDGSYRGDGEHIEYVDGGASGDSEMGAALDGGVTPSFSDKVSTLMTEGTKDESKGLAPKYSEGLQKLPPAEKGDTEITVCSSGSNTSRVSRESSTSELSCESGDENEPGEGSLNTSKESEGRKSRFTVESLSEKEVNASGDLIGLLSHDDDGQVKEKLDAASDEVVQGAVGDESGIEPGNQDDIKDIFPSSHEMDDKENEKHAPSLYDTLPRDVQARKREPSDDFLKIIENVTCKLEAAEKLQTSKIVPDRELFIWAVLNNRAEMAKYFWEYSTQPISTALMGARLCKKILETCDYSTGLEVISSYTDMKTYFEKVAKESLDAMAEKYPEQAIDIIQDKVSRWNDITCLQMATASDSRSFLASKTCQTYLKAKWRGGIRSPSWFVFLCSLFGLFFLVRFEKDKVQDVRFKTRRGRCRSSFLSDLFKRFILFYTSPLVKYILYTIFYILFLLFFTYMLLFKLEERINLTQCLVFLWVASYVCDELHRLIKFPLPSIRWKLIDNEGYTQLLYVLNSVMLLIAFFIHAYTDSFKHVRLIYCANLAIFYIRLLRAYTPSEYLGPKLYIIVEALKELLLFFAILFVFLLAYGVASYTTLYPHLSQSWDKFGEALKHIFFMPYWHLYGELNLDMISSDVECYAAHNISESNISASLGLPCRTDSSVFLPILLAIYMFIGNILLLNLIIAIFSRIFTDIESNSKQVWQFQMYYYITDYEVKSILPPPFNLIEYAIGIMRHFYHRVSLTRCRQIILPDTPLRKKEVLRWLEEETNRRYLRRQRELRDIESANLAVVINERLSNMMMEQKDLAKSLRIKAGANRNELQDVFNYITAAVDDEDDSDTLDGPRRHSTRRRRRRRASLHRSRSRHASRDSSLEASGYSSVVEPFLDSDHHSSDGDTREHGNPIDTARRTLGKWMQSIRYKKPTNDND